MPRDWLWIRDPNNWYWMIGADATQVYSSASGTFVPVSDQTYKDWLVFVQIEPAKIATVADLGIVLSDLAAPPPVDTGVLNAYKDAQLTKIDTVIFRILFNHENRIRSLNSQAAVSAQQFIAAIKALL